MRGVTLCYLHVILGSFTKFQFFVHNAVKNTINAAGMSTVIRDFSIFMPDSRRRLRDKGEVLQ